MKSPLISAIVATYNEADHIERCLQGLLHQQGVGDNYEIIVVDGSSTDATTQIIRDMPEFGRRIHLVSNPQRFQVFAWNLGIRVARGEYVVFISAHTEYGPNYLESCLSAARRTNADCVGAVQVARASNRVGSAIAWAMQSPFGVGNAKFRYTDVEQEVESVFGGFFKRDTLIRLGGYNEGNRFDEDGELSYRLRKSGGTIIVCPSIKVVYHPRDSLRQLAKQMFRYGYWRRKTQLQHGQKAVPLRIFAPPFLVVTIAFAVVAFTLTKMVAFAIVPIPYLLFLLGAMVVSFAQTKSAVSAMLVPAVLATMHFSYGLGYLSGLFQLRSDTRVEDPAPSWI